MNDFFNIKNARDCRDRSKSSEIENRSFVRQEN